jgi:hypothetical protein
MPFFIQQGAQEEPYMKVKLNLSLEEYVVERIKHQTHFESASEYITDLVQKDRLVPVDLMKLIKELNRKMDLILKDKRV